MNLTSRVGFVAAAPAILTHQPVVVPSARVNVPIAPVIQCIGHGNDAVADGKDGITPVDERVAPAFARARVVCDRACSAFALDPRVRNAAAVVVLSSGAVIGAAPCVNGCAPAVVRWRVPVVVRGASVGHACSTEHGRVGHVKRRSPRGIEA